MSEILTGGAQVEYTQSPKPQFPRYIHYLPLYRVCPRDCSGQSNCSGQNTDGCSWENRSTGAVFRAKPESKPTSIQRVAPVGQGTGRPAGLEGFYQDSEVESEIPHWTRTGRDADGI
jgi:hypothetical protein